MSRAITEREFEEWQAHPVTAQIREMFNRMREEYRQAWEGGSFTDYETGGTILVNVGNLGTCRGLATFTDLTYDKYVTEMEIDDGEQKRVGPEGSGSAD